MFPQINNMKVEREKALEHKNRMSRMVEDKDGFLSKITAARSFVYEVPAFSQDRTNGRRLWLRLQNYYEC